MNNESYLAAQDGVGTTQKALTKIGLQENQVIRLVVMEISISASTDHFTRHNKPTDKLRNENDAMKINNSTEKWR